MVIIISTFFTTIVSVTSPITNFALRNYMSNGLTLGGQRRLMENGYRRKPHGLNQIGRILSFSNIWTRINAAQTVAEKFARMIKITDSYRI